MPPIREQKFFLRLAALEPGFSFDGFVVTAICSLEPGFSLRYEATPARFKPPLGSFPALRCHAAVFFFVLWQNSFGQGSVVWTSCLGSFYPKMVLSYCSPFLLLELVSVAYDRGLLPLEAAPRLHVPFPPYSPPHPLPNCRRSQNHSQWCNKLA